MLKVPLGFLELSQLNLWLKIIFLGASGMTQKCVWVVFMLHIISETDDGAKSTHSYSI